MAAEALLVAQARDAHHHGVAVLAVREELQASRLAAELVFGIVEVGEVLDLRHREQAGKAGAEAEPQDRLLVEQGVEDPADSEPPGQSPRHPVDASFAADVLAEDQQLRVGGQRIGETAVDRVRQRHRPGFLRQPAAEGARTRRGIPGLGGPARHLAGVARRQRAGHLGAAGQAAVRHGLVGERPDPGAHRFVPADYLPRTEQAGRHDQARGPEQRVAGVVRRDLGLAPVRDLRVAAGVAEEAHQLQVQERGRAAGPHIGGCFRGGVKAGHRVASRRAEVAESRPPGVRLGDPAAWSPDADPQAVVLADQQQRHRQALIGRPAGGVDSAGRRGVARRRVPEAGHRDGVRGPRGRDPQLGGPPDRERDPDGSRQVRRDRGRLRDDGQVVVPEDLVTAARDRLVAGGDQAEQDVPQRLGAGYLRGAGQVEAARAVVEQRGVIGPQDRPDRRVGLVPRGTDRVEAAALGAQVPCGQVEMPAAGLGVEQGDGLFAGQPGPGRDGRGAVRRPGRRADGQAAHGRQEPHIQLLFRGDPLLLAHQPVRRNDSSARSSATSICAFWSDPE